MLNAILLILHQRQRLTKIRFQGDWTSYFPPVAAARSRWLQLGLQLALQLGLQLGLQLALQLGL